MQSSVSFPRARASSIRDNASWVSGRETRTSLTNRDVALEVHDLVYGPPVPGETPITSDVDVLASLERLYEPNAIYENPVVTATSREMILSIHNLTRQVADLEVARPRALLSWLFGYGKRATSEPSWFAASKCWSEIGDIVAESEGWDGTKRSVMEHTLHILLLPGLHVPSSSSARSHSPLNSSSSLEISVQRNYPTTSFIESITHPVLSFAGFNIPTPFHLKLRIISKLTFNEQGRVSAHRDFWDVRDVIGLLPGATTAQWALTRVAAHGLATASWFVSNRSRRGNNYDGEEGADMARLAAADAATDEGSQDIYGWRGKAPDTDPDSMRSP